MSGTLGVGGEERREERSWLVGMVWLVEACIWLKVENSQSICF